MNAHPLTIQTIVDRQLAAFIGGGINLWETDLGIAPSMLAPGQDAWAEALYWLPVASTVSAAELNELEKRIGYPLPVDYRAFLQHKHFYELTLANASFCSHPADHWQEQLLAMILGGHRSALMLEKGYIPFADL